MASDKTTVEIGCGAGLVMVGQNGLSVRFIFASREKVCLYPVLEQGSRVTRVGRIT